MLVQICRRYLRHLVPWTRNINGIPKPRQWAAQQYTIHYGNRRRRPPSIPGYRHIQKDGRLPRAQSVSETHPHQSLPTLELPSPSSQQTISPLFPDARSKSSLWPRFPYTRTWIPHHRLQGQGTTKLFTWWVFMHEGQNFWYSIYVCLLCFIFIFSLYQVFHCAMNIT